MSTEVTSNKRQALRMGFETSYGVRPATVDNTVFFEVPFKSFTHTKNIEIVDPDTRTGSRRPAAPDTGAQSVNMKITMKAFVPGANDALGKLFQMVLRKAPTSYSVTASTIGVATSAGVTTISDSGDGLAGALVGQYLKVVSSAGTVYGEVLTVAAGSLTISNSDASADVSAADPVTISGRNNRDADEQHTAFLEHYVGTAPKETITATTIAVAGASITDSASGFGDILVGDDVTITTTAGSKSGRVTVAAAGALTIDNSGAGADVSAGGSVTIVVTREVYYRFAGVTAGKINLSFSLNSPGTYEFDLYGSSMEAAVSTLGTVTAYTETAGLKSAENAGPDGFWQNPGKGYRIRNWALSLDNTMNPLMDAHYRDPFAQQSGKLMITFSGNSYFANPVKYDEWLNYVRQAIWFYLDNGTSRMRISMTNMNPTQAALQEDGETFTQNWGYTYSLPLSGVDVGYGIQVDVV